MTATTILITGVASPVQLSTDSSIMVQSLYVQAAHSNLAKAFIGVASINKTTFAGVTKAMDAKEDFAFADPMGANRIQLSDYWIDFATVGEKAMVTYWKS